MGQPSDFDSISKYHSFDQTEIENRKNKRWLANQQTAAGENESKRPIPSGPEIGPMEWCSLKSTHPSDSLILETIPLTKPSASNSSICWSVSLENNHDQIHGS
jgi:hypothetical protein